MNQELVDYIKQQLKAGEDRNEITKVLQNAGWDSGEIEAVFQSVQNTQSLVGKEASLENTQVAQEKKVKIRSEKKQKKIFRRSLHVLKWIAIILVSLALFLYFLPNILGLFFRDIALIDPYDGKDLKYSLEEKIDSAGGDKVDDGGDVEKDDVYQVSFGDETIISGSELGDDWVWVDVLELGIMIPVPHKDMKIRKDEDLLNTFYISNDTIEYYFGESKTDSYEELVEEVLASEEKEVLNYSFFDTKNIGEIIFMCPDDPKQFRLTCLGAGILPNKQTFQFGCRAEEKDRCVDDLHTTISHIRISTSTSVK